MTLELDTLNLSDIKLEDFEGKLIRDKAEVLSWAEVVSKAFQMKIDNDFLYDLYREKHFCFYIGFYKQKVVSSLLMLNSSGVTGLHAVSTLPEYRGKGFGLKLSEIALKDARSMGYKMAVLHASDLGLKLYQKLGFQKCGDILSYELP
jgi:predicted acetyltransferase